MAEAEAEEGCSADAVRDFLIANGGRATNVQVVRHFAKYLSDPEWKVLNKQKFKDYINEVATVKSEKGEKFLVLKSESFYREWIEPKHVIIRPAQSHPAKPSWPPPEPERPKEPDPVPPARRKKKAYQDQNGSTDKGKGGGHRPKSGGGPRPTISAPIYTGPAEQQSVVSTVMGEKVIEELSQIEGVQGARDKFELESRLQTPSPVKEASPAARAAIAEAASPGSSTTLAEMPPAVVPLAGVPPAVVPPAVVPPAVVPPVVVPPSVIQIQVTKDEKTANDTPTPMEGVKEEAVERSEQDSRVAVPGPNSQPLPAATAASAVDVQKADPESSQKHHHHHDDDDDQGLVGSDLTESVSSDTLRSIKSTSSGNSYPDSKPQLEPLERQWMMESAKGNVPGLMDLLDKEPGLVGKKDFITGFSALHWGAKHGKKEMIRLVVDRGVNVNMRSQGGYTPLHVAAMHNKEAIMQFLLTEYNADINKRDYSGRKAHHYLQSTASNYIKQMMQGQSTADVIQPNSLILLAEPKQEEKSHSRLSSILRHSFRHSFRLWGSAENLEDKDHKRERMPPVTPPPSPKSQHKGAHSINYSQSLLMPPPSGYTVPNRARKLRSTSDKQRAEEQLRKVESDPDIMTEISLGTFV